MPLESLWRSFIGRLTPDRAGGGDGGAIATLRNLLDAAPAAIVTSARDGSITTWNRAAERLFGWKQDEVIGRPPPYLVPEAQAAEAALRRRVLAGNELFRRRGRFQLRDHTAVDMLVSAVPQRDPDGGIVGIISVFEETVAATSSPVIAAPTHPAPTAAMRAPAIGDTAVAGPARADARPDSVTAERPSQFLARVSHDLRQPLHALSLLTGALERRVK